MSHSHSHGVGGSHAGHNHVHAATEKKKTAEKKKLDLSKMEFLKAGSKGPQVKLLEKKLIEAGFLEGKPGSSFDKETAAAVKKYQKEKNLLVDGLVGQQTWASLYGSKAEPGTNLLKGGGPSGGASGSAGGSSGGGAVSGVGSPGGSQSAKLKWASDLARKLGLTITSTTGGTHAPGSYHYSGRAIDVAGSPAAMAKFYDTIKAKTSPTELFYDPRGGIKHGQEIGAIGGHGDHVHVAF